MAQKKNAAGHICPGMSPAKSVRCVQWQVSAVSLRSARQQPSCDLPREPIALQAGQEGLRQKCLATKKKI